MLPPKQLSSSALQSTLQPTVVNQTIENYPAVEAINLNHVPSRDEVNDNEETVGERNARAHTQSAQDDQSMEEVSVESDEFYIDNIVSHQTNRDKRHPNAKVGDTLYHVRWIGYDSKDDTWEPLQNPTRSHVTSNH